MTISRIEPVDDSTELQKLKRIQALESFLNCVLKVTVLKNANNTLKQQEKKSVKAFNAVIMVLAYILSVENVKTATV